MLHDIAIYIATSLFADIRVWSLSGSTGPQGTSRPGHGLLSCQRWLSIMVAGRPCQDQAGKDLWPRDRDPIKKMYLVFLSKIVAEDDLLIFDLDLDLKKFFKSRSKSNITSAAWAPIHRDLKMIESPNAFIQWPATFLLQTEQHMKENPICNILYPIFLFEDTYLLY